MKLETRNEGRHKDEEVHKSGGSEKFQNDLGDLDRTSERKIGEHIRSGLQFRLEKIAKTKEDISSELNNGSETGKYQDREKNSRAPE